MRRRINNQNKGGTDGKGFINMKGSRRSPGATNLMTSSCQPVESPKFFLVKASAVARVKAQRILIGNQEMICDSAIMVSFLDCFCWSGLFRALYA